MKRHVCFRQQSKYLAAHSEAVLLICYRDEGTAVELKNLLHKEFPWAQCMRAVAVAIVWEKFADIEQFREGLDDEEGGRRGLPPDAVCRTRARTHLLQAHHARHRRPRLQARR